MMAAVFDGFVDVLMVVTQSPDIAPEWRRGQSKGGGECDLVVLILDCCNNELRVRNSSYCLTT
jgi:hypothetical protein